MRVVALMGLLEAFGGIAENVESGRLQPHIEIQDTAADHLTSPCYQSSVVEAQACSKSVVTENGSKAHFHAGYGLSPGADIQHQSGKNILILEKVDVTHSQAFALMDEIRQLEPFEQPGKLFLIRCQPGYSSRVRRDTTRGPNWTMKPWPRNRILGA